ncbi:GFA family protein [Marinobacter mobilis]|uniref:Uncharacterized conserved protein n=1 Tax=Marinobacter mobilis TaxID=488533 RepID=A0A1H2WLP0_9GAMM|nr:GFA family protein [Marinobacter mobilis]SDW81396.1 Uncharacterized conserved protein [Marinobacter mobilis]
MTTRGSCLCGQVRFEIDGDFESFYLCHCTHCRKDTGSAHAANLFSGTASLRWLAGADTVRRYQLPATRHVKSFCSVCGSAVPTEQPELKVLVVPAGCLDDDIRLRPTAHLFVASKAGWDEDLEQVPAFDGLPRS